MALTVNSAFSHFLVNTVNLAPLRVKTARNSRDAMFARINSLQGFLPLAKNSHMQFGSFARGTKIRPIDDIDLIICLSGEGLIECRSNNWADYKIKLTDTTSIFKKYCDISYFYTSTYYLNSNKIKNAFKTALSALHDCSKAELHSRGEAITLKFTSYEWNFDIVPAFYVVDGDYYLIPNGTGGWKKTNPKIDRDRVKVINSKCDGNALSLVRLTKYWNRRQTMATMPSYLLEAMVLNYCESNAISNYIDIAFRNFLDYLFTHVDKPVYDPKGIQGNINTLNIQQQRSISQRAYADYLKAKSAIEAEVSEQNQAKAIGKWREIFGGEFPNYG